MNISLYRLVSAYNNCKVAQLIKLPGPGWFQLLVFLDRNMFLSFDLIQVQN